MKKILEKIRLFFSSLGARFKRKPGTKAVPAVNEPITTPRKQNTQSAKPKKADRFTVISWVVTLLLVAALLGGTVFYKNSRPAIASASQPTSVPTSESSAGTNPSQRASHRRQRGRIFIHRP